MEGVTVPDVGKAVGAVEFRVQARPLTGGAGMLSVKREVRSPRGVAVAIRILLHFHEGFRRRVIPEVALVEIFARGGVGDTAGLVRLSHGQAAALPFAEQPLLEREG